MATKIRILPENLTNKIAAGEVVERPASVAKELVENALDAGSREVVLEIESGGRRLIKVTDAGCGMSREDALLALERHATSKIASDEDLFALSTLGFRGEALPSIASVSRLTISTRSADTVEGTEIYAEGGRIKEVKECGMAAGTVIAVRNLFFNTPARLKFMKSAETEGGHVGELLTRLAISRPDVRFSFVNDGRVVFRALDSSLKDRVATMLGRPIAASLYPVSYQDAGGLKVTGLVAAPECSRSAASHLYTYINGRFIKDKVVQHAILQAYRNFLERGRYPVVAVFIEIPPGEVDVNVHPTKHEVRFREQGRVHDAIQGAVEAVLKGTPWLKQRSVAQQAAAPAPRTATRQESTLPPDTPPQEMNDGGISAAKVAEVRELLVGFKPRPQPPLRPQYQASSPSRVPTEQGRGDAANRVAEEAAPFDAAAASQPAVAGTAARMLAAGDLTVRTPEVQPIPAAAGSPRLAAEEAGDPRSAGAGLPAGPAPVTAEIAVGGVAAGVAAASVAAPAGMAASGTMTAGDAGRSAAATTYADSGVAAIAAVGTEGGMDSPPRVVAVAAPCSDAASDSDDDPGYFSALSIIGQFNATYILCQQGTDLVLIDQHAAHERVAFERLKAEFAGKQVDSQGLLFPETIELSFRESAALQENLEELCRLGFGLEEFGGNTWLLKGVPQVLAETEYLRIIRDILEELGSLGRSRTFSDVQEDILARLACHSVVRGRRPLTQQEIVALFAQMDRTDFSSNCPHGRPVMQRITLAEMEKMFKRG